jgi:hypothetical protein
VASHRPAPRAEWNAADAATKEVQSVLTDDQENRVSLEKTKACGSRKPSSNSGGSI